ncbi:hypothetical protein [Ottowia beijingensis]|uniref:hypothetical protein n=1 Tax=Ottowia beijingensis TaxID=1207057 RepID=UPI00366ED8C6
MGTSLSAAELPGAPIGWKAGLQRQDLVARSKNSLSGFRPTAERDALNDPNKKSGLRAAFLLGALTSFQFQIKAAIARHSGAKPAPYRDTGPESRRRVRRNMDSGLRRDDGD